MSRMGTIVLVACLLLLSQGSNIVQTLRAQSDKPFPLTAAEIDSVIERAARRTDQKLNARWMALLDSIIVEVHEQFLSEYKAKIDSLKHKEAIRHIKKRLLKATSADSSTSAKVPLEETMKPIDQCSPADFTKAELWEAVETLMRITCMSHTDGGDMQNAAVAYLEDIGIAVYAEDMEE